MAWQVTAYFAAGADFDADAALERAAAEGDEDVALTQMGEANEDGRAAWCIVFSVDGQFFVAEAKAIYKYRRLVGPDLDPSDWSLGIGSMVAS